MKTISRIEAAEKLGIPVNEVTDVAASQAGDIIVTNDGQGYIVVPEDNVDAAGRHGVMYLTVPDNYGDAYSVYSPPADLELPSRDELAEALREAGIHEQPDPGSDQAALELAAKDLQTGPSVRDLGIVVELDELAKYTGAEIVAYADRHFGVKISPSWAKARMIKEISNHLAGQQTETLGKTTDADVKDDDKKEPGTA